MTRTPPPYKECYFEEDAYVVNDQTGVSDQMPKGPRWILGAMVKKTKVRSMAIKTKRINMSKKAATIATTTTTG